MCPPDEIKIRERNVNHNFIIGGIFVQVNSVLIILLYDMTIFFIISAICHFLLNKGRIIVKK